MTTTLPEIAIYGLRATQVLIVGLGVVLVLGAVLGGMNVLATAMLALIALFGMALAVCLELLAVWPIRRRWGADADA